MKPMPLSELAAAVEGALQGTDGSVVVGPDVVIDSRKTTPGALFVAFPGERVDGHDYIAKAAADGAAAILCTRLPELEAEISARCVVVDDATTAMGRLARHVVDSLPELTVVGVTGSSGKTSTKDLVAQLLEVAGPTIAPPGSFNNEIGAPLTATRCTPDTRFLVAEMGARGKGHVAYLCSLTPPQIGMVLNVGHAHVGEFGSRDAIAEAKGELVEALPADGWAVLNANDERVAAMASRTRAKIAWFGLAYAPEQPGDLRVWASDIVSGDLDRHSFTMRVRHADGSEEAHEVALPLIGRHQVSNAVAAAAAAIAAGVAAQQVAETLSRVQVRSKMRMELHQRADGVVIVNDAYNANPDSMLAACEALAAMQRRRRPVFPQVQTWAVLGQMYELGETTVAEHEAVGRAVGSLQIDHLLALGENAVDMVRGAEACPDALVAADVPDALAKLKPAPGDIVLVKASRAMALEQVADALLGEGPEHKKGGVQQ